MALPPVEPWHEIMPRDPLEELEVEGAAIAPADMGFHIRVAPELQALVKPMSQFKPHPRNFRKHKLEAISASLRKFGQQSPMVVQKSTGFVCKGNGTFRALTGLGVTEAAFSVEEFDDDTAFEYLLADNRASDLASYEREALAEALQQLMDGPGLQDTLWTVDDVDNLRAELGTITIVEPEAFKGGYSEHPDDLAKRQALAGTPADKMREVPIVMGVADHARFMADIAVLKKEYGTSGTIATVIEAVRRAAANATVGNEAPVLARVVPEEAAEPEGVSGSLPVPTPVSADLTEEELLARLGL